MAPMWIITCRQPVTRCEKKEQLLYVTGELETRAAHDAYLNHVVARHPSMVEHDAVTVVLGASSIDPDQIFHRMSATRFHPFHGLDMVFTVLHPLPDYKRTTNVSGTCTTCASYQATFS